MKKQPKLPPAPSHLSKEAVEWWNKVNTDYVLDDSALLILTSALESFDRMKEAAALVKKHGVLVKDRWGQLKSNPATVTERDARSAMLVALKALRLDIEPSGTIKGR